MELSEEALRRLFPNLIKELESGKQKVTMNSVRTEVHTGENVACKKFVDYKPDVVDFMRRCETKKQAEEIIRYLEKRGEIDKQYAEKLRDQLRKRGVRSFGPKKEKDYYLRHGH